MASRRVADCLPDCFGWPLGGSLMASLIATDGLSEGR
jgi:hypothetical protein